MELLFDLHTHTNVSGHAYSSLLENIQWAKKMGLKAYGFSEHTEAMPGAPNNVYFTNFKILPKNVDDIRLVSGAEVNVMDFQGNIDLPDKIAANLDYLIASLHIGIFTPGSKEENTQALINTMANPYIKIIGHPDDDRFPLDTDLLAKAAKESGVLLELNNSSLLSTSSRVNAPINSKKMLLDCIKHQTRIVVNSDSHVCFDVGRFDEARVLLAETDFPEELVANVDLTHLDKWILKDRTSAKL